MALYVRECFDVVELGLGMIRLSLYGMADILVRLCYRLPNQDEETDEVFYEQLAEVV